MSRLAREHPEDNRYQSLEGQYEALVEKYDSEDKLERDINRKWNENTGEILPCPFCGVPLDEPHRAQCRLRESGEG